MGRVINNGVAEDFPTELQAQAESYKSEQQTLTDEMGDDVPLSDAVIAHSEK